MTRAAALRFVVPLFDHPAFTEALGASPSDTAIGTRRPDEPSPQTGENPVAHTPWIA
mgnify:CR=1 FL=1